MAADESGRGRDCEAAPAAAQRPDAALHAAGADDDDDFTPGVCDSRLALAYLLSRASDDYIAVMDVLEASVTDMTPADVVAALAAAGYPMSEPAVVKRLDKLRTWSAVSARTDHGRILRYSDIAARNWRHTPKTAPPRAARPAAGGAGPAGAERLSGSRLPSAGSAGIVFITLLVEPLVRSQPWRPHPVSGITRRARGRRGCIDKSAGTGAPVGRRSDRANQA